MGLLSSIFPPTPPTAELIYLASPYSSKSSVESVRRAEEAWRYDEVCRHAAQYVLEGYVIFCPIAHSHPLRRFGADGDWYSWADTDYTFLRCSKELWVLQLPGWEESTGVREEMKYFRKLIRPIFGIPWDGEGKPVRSPKNLELIAGVHRC